MILFHQIFMKKDICDERTDKRTIKFDKKSLIKSDGISLHPNGS